MTIRQTRPGECLLIPKTHIDHFTDIEDELAAHIMVVAQRIGRAMLTAFPCDRVGYVVHGYDVGHAHLILVPQQAADDIVSGRHARVVDGSVVFDETHLMPTPRQVLDDQARRLAAVMTRGK